jgi:hypothetical protein
MGGGRGVCLIFAMMVSLCKMLSGVYLLFTNTKNGCIQGHIYCFYHPVHLSAVEAAEGEIKNTRVRSTGLLIRKTGQQGIEPF